MKLKHVMPVALLVVAFSAVKSQAQEKKNYVSGSIGFNSISQEYPNSKVKYNNFNVMPTYGHYISEKFSIGITAGYTHGAGEDKVTGESKKINGFNVGPFIRFEQPIWGDKVTVYNDLGLNYMHSKGSSDLKSEDGEYSSNAGILFYRPGIMVNFTKRTSLLLNLGNLLTIAHSVDKSPTIGTVRQTTAGVQSGFGINSLNIGFQYKF
ncbi:outer membrane beta-barrel protein [Chitinophaga dinghuensis]|nr:outer membrane beta-barrel protein [Chitinophaga dinghuensis]